MSRRHTNTIDDGANEIQVVDVDDFELSKDEAMEHQSQITAGGENGAGLCKMISDITKLNEILGPTADLHAVAADLFGQLKDNIFSKEAAPNDSDSFSNVNKNLFQNTNMKKLFTQNLILKRQTLDSLELHLRENSSQLDEDDPYILIKQLAARHILQIGTSAILYTIIVDAQQAFLRGFQESYAQIRMLRDHLRDSLRQRSLLKDSQAKSQKQMDEQLRQAQLKIVLAERRIKSVEEELKRARGGKQQQDVEIEQLEDQVIQLKRQVLKSS